VRSRSVTLAANGEVYALPTGSEAKSEEQDRKPQATQNPRNAEEQTAQGDTETDDDDIEANDKGVESDVDGYDQGTESRNEVHDGCKAFSDDRNDAGKYSSDRGVRGVCSATLVDGGGLRLRIGAVHGANELVDERLSLGRVGRSVRCNALELGHDGADRRLQIVDDGLRRHGTLLSVRDWVGGRR